MLLQIYNSSITQYAPFKNKLCCNACVYFPTGNAFFELLLFIICNNVCLASEFLKVFAKCSAIKCKVFN